MIRIARWIVPLGIGLLLWLGTKQLFGISDRYLPGLDSIVAAVSDIGADWPRHILATATRTVVGFVIAIVAGLALALLLFKTRLLSWLLPLVHSVRAVPAVAIVPFFLLWFGFSEIGRYLLVVLGIGLNVLVAAADVLEQPSERDRVIFRNFGLPLASKVIDYWGPRVLETLLPTLRFGVALALGVIVVSEMLGAQSGLGYLMQTARATFSLNVILLCAIILGIMATALDFGLVVLWRMLIDWRE